MTTRPAHDGALFITQSSITANAALQAIEAAVAHAESLAIKIVVAVVDSQGSLTGFLRMPGAFHMSTEMATKKARSVAGTGCTADVLEQLFEAAGAHVREGLLQHPDVTVLRGGLPIRVNNQLIGAIGISGGSEAQDEACAAAGLTALGLG